MQNKHELRENAHSNIRKENPDEFIQRTSFHSNDGKHSNLLDHYVKFFDHRTKVFPFLPTLCEILKGPDNYQLDYDSRQYVLLGQPSAGKTTELRRIAKDLVTKKNLNENQIVHLCCLQNSSTVQREIETKEDLWEWIMRSHDSRIWSQERFTFDDFDKIHSDYGLKPILLVDTVDLLIYGEIGTQKEEKISELWKQLVDDCKEKGWTVLWSCRRHEWNIMTKNNSDIDLIEIVLPPLSEKGIRKKFKDVGRDENFLEDHMVALSLAFPIIVGHKLNYSKKYSTREIQDDFLQFHIKMRNVSLDEELLSVAGPTSWIVPKMNGKIATDILYEGIVKKLHEYLHKMYHYEQDEIAEYWKQIEKEFYFAAKTKSGGARIQIESDYLNDLEDQTLTKAMTKIAQRFGLLEDNGGTYEMTHQLFAEYCVWKHKDENDGEMIKKFPSSIFRSLTDGANQNELIEGQKWFLPYILFNKDLAEVGSNLKQYPHLTGAWAEAAEHAHRYQPRERLDLETTLVSNKDIANERKINDEKMKIIKELNNDYPLIINGPPGVGKTHLSYIWMDKIALGDHWIQLQPNVRRILPSGSELPKAYFMTQSQRLARQISEKVDQYFGQDPRPVRFEDWSVDEYLSSLEKVLGKGYRTYTFENFDTEWNEYCKGASAELRNIPNQALWNEYLHRMIDNRGKLKSVDEYMGNRNSKTDVFKFCTNPEKEAKTFSKWVNDIQRTSSRQITDDKKVRLSLAERAGKAIEQIIPILTNGTLDEQESVASLQPDILILDEIQDLPAPVILLMLLMHKGKRNSVMMCGDDEQTLELIKFDWEVVFSKMSTAIYQLCEENKDLERLDFVDKWRQTGDGLSLNKVQQLHTKYLTVVERSIPQIVDTLRQSWTTSVMSNPIRDELGMKSEKGTGAIRPGDFAVARFEKNNKLKREQGVSFFEATDSEWFKKISSEIYEDALDVAILLPSQKQLDEYREILDQNGTDLELWTPRLIKGLEYSVVIAVNPWHIDEKHFSDVVSQSSTKSWQAAETYVLDNKRNDSDKVIETRERIKLLAEQRLRHSNIMLSRGMDKLLIITQNKDNLIETKNFDSEPVDVEKTKLEKQYHWFDKSGRSNYQGINRLIKRLSLIILSAESKGDRTQVMYKSKHILKTLEKDKSSKLLPFYLLSIVEPSDELDIFSEGIDGFSNALSLISPLDTDEYSDWNDFPELNDLWNYINEIAQYCRDEGDNGFRIPILRFNEYNSRLEQYVREFSQPDFDCFDENEGDMDDIRQEQEKQRRIISDYITERIFGGRRESTLKIDEWCEAAKTIQLEDFSKELSEELNPRFKFITDLLRHGSAKMKKKVLSKKELNEIDKAFWKEGEHHIVRIGSSDLQKICNRIYEQLKTNSLSYEGVKFVSKIIPQYLNDSDQWRIREKLTSEGIIDLCNICNALQREANRQKYELKNIFSQIDVDTAEVIASQLIKQIPLRTVSNCLLDNSFGLFDLLKHFMEKPSFQEFTFEKSIRLGDAVLKDLAERSDEEMGQAEWEHPVITQLQSYSISKLGRANFTSVQTVSTLDIKFIRNVLKRRGEKENTFSSSLRWRLGRNERKGIIMFMLKKLYFEKVKEKTTIINKREVKELLTERVALFPMSELDADRKEWELLFNDRTFFKELVQIPYEDKLSELSPDMYFGRIPGQFTYAKNWNAALFDALSNRGLGNGLLEASKEIEKKTDSVFDQCKETIPRAKNMVHEHMQMNISSKHWRENVLRNGVNLEKAWTYDFIPRLNAKQSIMLYLHLERLKSNMLKSLNSIRNAYQNISDTYSTMKELSKHLPRAERKEFFKEYKQELREIGPEIEARFKKLDKAVNEITQFNVKDVLEKLTLYFHRLDGNGQKVITLRKKWKILADEFLDYEYPYCYEILGDEDNYRANSELLAEFRMGQLSLFSLSFMNKECQIALIIFLQKFATKTDYIPGNTPVRIQTPEEVREYSVIMPDQHGSIKGGLKLLQNLPDL